MTKTPPTALAIPRNLWEELVDACHPEESLFWDYYPQATPRTPVDLDDDVTNGHDEGAEKGSFHTSYPTSAFIYSIVDCTDIVEPLVLTWTIETDEVPAATSASRTQEVKTVKSTVKSAGPSLEASSRIPRLAPTSVWKKSIDALVSKDKNKVARPIRSPTSATSVVSSADVIASASSSSPSSTSALKFDWSEDVEQVLFTAEQKMDEKAGVIGVSKAKDRVFEKCNCALESVIFEPESWNKFKIPASCHRRPPIHFISPRDTDKCNPSTRIAVDNVNAFRSHSIEPNVPYANKDVEDLFYGVGAKNVRCFDGRVVGGVVRYNTSYAVVDFETVEDAKAAFKIFQGRKAYPGSYHLRLKFVDVGDRTFGRRMAVSMGPMERSEEERRAFSEFVEDLDRVDVDLAKVALPSRPGFTLPVRPATSKS